MTQGYKNFKIKVTYVKDNVATYRILTPEDYCVKKGKVDFSKVHIQRFYEECKKVVDNFLAPTPVTFW